MNNNLFYKRYLDAPLHYGHAPRWLFEKMVSLCSLIFEFIIQEYGVEYLLEKISDPYWFQCLGCILGFDWHSSGLTTTLCGVFKEVCKDKDWGLFVCGGKGRVSRNTPYEIESVGGRISKDVEVLINTSRLVAKIDNSALQDGFTLYHHTFIFDSKLNWIVIQQGMSKDGWARRYHWHHKYAQYLFKDPHAGIISSCSFLTLNMVDKDKDNLRNLVVDLSSRPPEKNLKDIDTLKSSLGKLPYRHRILLEDINPKYLFKIFLSTYEVQPKDFSEFLSLSKVGPKTIRALALIADLIYGEPISFRDPARFSFAHGGKDGYPYKINLVHYQKTIDNLQEIVKRVPISYYEKNNILKKLFSFYNSVERR